MILGSTVFTQIPERLDLKEKSSVDRAALYLNYFISHLGVSIVIPITQMKQMLGD